MLEKSFFLGKGPGQGHITGLLGHGSQIYTHNQNMVKTTNIWFAGYFSDVEISPNIYEVH
jgi:hypothetical protein